MKKYINITLLLALLVSLSSCASVSISRRSDTISFKPTEVRLDIDMDDFELLGDVEVSIDYRTYLGVFTSIDMVNNELYDQRNKQNISVSNLSLAYKGRLSKAMYKVFETYPETDYIMPVYVKNQTHNMFLGSSVNKVAKFKAYKFKK